MGLDKCVALREKNLRCRPCRVFSVFDFATCNACRTPGWENLACSRLSVSEDDRKSERATSGISCERDPGVSTLTESLEQARRIKLTCTSFDSFLLICTSFAFRARGSVCFVYLLFRLANDKEPCERCRSPLCEKRATASSLLERKGVLFSAIFFTY